MNFSLLGRRATANQADKDIPYEMQDIMDALSGAVHAHVTKSGTFPKDCELNDLAVAHPGDGFRFLRLVVTRVHTGWHEQPGVALRSPPKQDDGETLLHYHMLFMDYLLMSGYIFK